MFTFLASQRNGTLYVGVTSHPVQRAWQHREGVVKGFTKKYGVKRLVWYELHATMESAIAREKQLKAGKRARKIQLIEAMNPDWRDLYRHHFLTACPHLPLRSAKRRAFPHPPSLRGAQRRGNPCSGNAIPRAAWIATGLRPSQ